MSCPAPYGEGLLYVKPSLVTKSVTDVKNIVEKKLVIFCIFLGIYICKDENVVYVCSAIKYKGGKSELEGRT